MAISKRALAGLSVEDLKALIKQKRKEEKVAPLREERDRLAARLAKIERKIEKLLGEAKPGRKTGRKPGRPPKKARRRLSPEARARIIAGQKRRWAEYHQALAKKKAAQDKAAAPQA